MRVSRGARVFRSGPAFARVETPLYVASLMSPEQPTIRRSHAVPAVRENAVNEAKHAPPTARAGAVVPADPERLFFRVSFPGKGDGEEDSRLYPVTANGWQRLQIPLPADWQGGGLRLDPQCRFGLLEIVGVRVVSAVMGESLWEKLGRDLVDGVRVSAGMQVLSHRLRLRLLCTGEDAQIVLPDLALPGAEVPLVLELGLRLRTELASIGYSLHEWVDEADAERHDALARFAVAEAARVYGVERATALLAEVDVARTDANQREAALREQLAAAHEDARAHAATLAAEIEAARQDGRQQVAALNAQLTATREAAEAHAATLTAEIEAARAHGEERAAALLAEVEALREQLTAAHEAARAHAATLTAEIEAARAHGEERAAALLAEVEALREQLTAAHEAARAHAATLTAEIEMARAYGEQRAAALMAAIEEARRQIDEDQAQRLALRAEQASESQKFAQTLHAIRTELAEARGSSEEHRGRVRSMQRSLSWRLTLPLRVMGRALTGRRTKSGHRQP